VSAVDTDEQNMHVRPQAAAAALVCGTGDGEDSEDDSEVDGEFVPGEDDDDDDMGEDDDDDDDDDDDEEEEEEEEVRGWRRDQWHLMLEKGCSLQLSPV